MGWQPISIHLKKNQNIIIPNMPVQSCTYLHQPKFHILPISPLTVPDHHKASSIFLIPHAGLAQLPECHQEESQCFHERRRQRCQWLILWLQVHNNFLGSKIVQDCITIKLAHVGTINQNLQRLIFFRASCRWRWMEIHDIARCSCFKESWQAKEGFKE